MTPGLARPLKTVADLVAEQRAAKTAEDAAALAAEAADNPRVADYFRDVAAATARRLRELQRLEQERHWRNPPRHPSTVKT